MSRLLPSSIKAIKWLSLTIIKWLKHFGAFPNTYFKSHLHSDTVSSELIESHRGPGPHSSLMHWPGSLSKRRHRLKACSHLRLLASITWLAQRSLVLVIKTSDGLPPTRVLWVDLVITVCRFKTCFWKPQRWVIRTAPCRTGSINVPTRPSRETKKEQEEQIGFLWFLSSLSYSILGAGIDSLGTLLKGVSEYCRIEKVRSWGKQWYLLGTRQIYYCFLHCDFASPENIQTLG